MWVPIDVVAQIQSAEALAIAAGFVGLSADTGVVVQNALGEVVAASTQAQRILGLTFAQMRGRTSYDPRWAAVDEFGQPLLGAQHPAMRALRMSAANHHTLMGVHRPGSEAPGHHVWLDVSAIPLNVTEDVAPWAVVVAFRPITGERRRILEMRDSERFYRMIAEHSSDLITWQFLADFTYLWVSPASRALLGVDPDALVGTCGIDLVHPGDLAAVQQWRRSLPPHGRARGMTFRMRHADGSYRFIETTAHVIVAKDGTPAQLITSKRDVTDRVEAEQARDTAIQLAELAMAHATIGIALMSGTGIISRVNSALCAVLGRSADDLVGHNLREFTAGPDTLADRGLSEVEAGICDHHEIEQQFRGPDGVTVWCIRTVVALPGAAGVPTHLLVQLQDVTERKDVAAQLEKAALTDLLTGLPNRAGLEDRLTRALASAQRNETSVGVLFIDLDHFKQINDTLGHDVGDTLLREVGVRLLSTVRHSDTVVRLGGDEFVVVREDVTDVAELNDVAGRIREVFGQPFSISGHKVTIAASVGAATGQSVTARELINLADQAMYQVKKHR